MNKLRVDNLFAGYGAIQILQDVSINMDGGKLVVLLGTNGNGKTTLLKSIMGLIRPNAGSVSLDISEEKIDITGKPTEEIVNMGVSMVPEGRHLFPFLTVDENMMLGSFRKQARKNSLKNKEFCYSAFPILKKRRLQMAGTLSGGEQQMLAIARALMADPKILLIDEASQGLAPVIISELMEKIKDLKESRGLTILMTEQNFNQAVKVADSGYIMVHGKIICESKTNEELRENKHVKDYYLGIERGEEEVIQGKSK